MKTQLRTRSLRNLVISAIVAASLNVAVSAQPNPDRSSMAVSYSDRLELSMDRFEQSLNYVAPDDQAIEMEKEVVLRNLELVSLDIENKLKYKSPVEFETQIDQELGILADNMMKQLEYHAPVYDEFTNTFNGKPGMSALRVITRPLITDDCTPQEAWLLNAGYYKASKKSIVQKDKTEDYKNKYVDNL